MVKRLDVHRRLSHNLPARNASKMVEMKSSEKIDCKPKKRGCRPKVTSDNSLIDGFEDLSIFEKVLDKTVDLYKTHRKLSISKRAPHAARIKSIFSLYKPQSVEDLIDDQKLSNFFG